MGPEAVIKAFTLIARRPGLDHTAFRAYWRDVHAGVVMSLAETRPLRYVQNHLDAAVRIYGVPATDGVAESWRASLADLPRPLHENPRWLAVVRPDEERFVDLPHSGNIVAEELVALDGPATPWKLLRFLAGDAGARPAGVVRHVVNTPLPGRQRMLDGAEPPLAFALVEELWFDARDALDEARALLAARPATVCVVQAREHVVRDGLDPSAGGAR